MARRVPKPLLPLLVAVTAVGLATAAALPSFAGPTVTPDPSPSVSTPAPSAPAPAPSTEAPTQLKGGGGQGPRDCVNCGAPDRD